MKINILIIFISCFSFLSFGQELIVKSSFENIQYVENVEWYNDDIYCAGYSYKTKWNDGSSSDAYLINYDSLLKPKWSLKIDDKKTNIIYSIKRHKNKIYALITQGEIQPLTQNVFINLYIVNLDGIIESKIPFGTTFQSPSNIVFDGDNLVFGHKVANGINYSSNAVSEIIKYNIVTKKIERHKSKQYFSRPKKIIVSNAVIYLFGIYLHKDQPNILVNKKGKLDIISLKPNKEEYFLDSYIHKNILTVLSVFPGENGDLNKYLKYYYVNIMDNSIKSKTITYRELGWSDERFDTFSALNGSWIIIEDQQTKVLMHILLDKNGKIKNTLNYDATNGNGNWDRYIINNGRLLSANSEGIKMYRTG